MAGPLEPIAMAEAIAAMSLAIDLGMGQPLEQGLRTCAVATGLAERYGLDEDGRRDVYDLALLRHIGCTAGSDEIAELLGDEVAFHAGAITMHTTPKEMFPYLIRHVGAGDPPLRRARRLGTAMVKSKAFLESSRSVCEVGAMLAGRLGLAENVRAGLWQVFERWDGRGIPDGRRGEDILLAARFIRLAEMVEGAARMAGERDAVAAARDVVSSGRGTAFDPTVADCFADNAEELVGAASSPSVWAAVVGGRPGPRRLLDDEEADRVFEAMADFVDQKSTFTFGHSREVAATAAAAGASIGLSADDVTTLRRAGLAHDVGRAAISTSIWNKTEALNHDDWEKIRLHPYYTERALSRPAAIAAIGSLAADHHERIDGSGYHRAVPATVLSPSARILAAADCYQAMTEPRPHRPALGPDEAARRVRDDVRSGRLDGDAAEAVLTVTGNRATTRRRATIAGLTGREVEVLQLAAQGGSIKTIAAALTVSPKTVDAHLQHIYSKIGVTTRAGAVLFALERGLISRS